MGLSDQNIGSIIILTGVLMVLAGIIIWYGGFSWFGNLPGDIRIVRENMRIYIPITSMLLISILLTILLNLLRKFF